jgi:putative ABC transport system permease protein
VTITYVLMQNLKRNRLRTGLTAIAFALPMGVFVAAISLVVALERMAAAKEKELRLGVHHKTSIINLLPHGMRRKIEELDPERRRLISVCGMRWFGGRVPNTQNDVHSLATDVDSFAATYSEIPLGPQDLEAWHRERRAAIVGAEVARKYGWHPGGRMVLESTVPPYSQLEFVVTTILESRDQATAVYFRRDYLEEELTRAGFEDPAAVHIFWVKCRSAEALHSLQKEIDAAFANTPDATKSEDENAFIANFTQGLGDIPGLMQAMAGVVVLIVAMVAGNTMMMSFRERTRELGVFKAIGFPSRRLFLIVLAESMMLALIGSLLGIVPATLALVFVPLRGFEMGPIRSLEVSPLAVTISLGIALAVGAAAGLWPAWRAMRLQTVEALRKVA